MKIAVIGGGLIGTSWCALFLVHGHEVCVFDVAPDIEGRVRDELRRIQPYLEDLGLKLDPQTASLQVTQDLRRAVARAELVQECGPERLAFKQKLWAEVERFCPAEALLASSSSGLTASLQSRRMRSPGRLLVAHPFNPPHLIPLVELVPGRKTDAAQLQKAKQLYEGLGKKVVVLRKEIPGFVANRIQAAVIRESVSLVQQGIVSAEDLDVAVTQSLGLRWAVDGPLRSMHLGGGAGGIRAFLKQFGTGLELLWLHMLLRPVWLRGASKESLSRAIESANATASINELASQRDQQQIAVRNALDTSLEKSGKIITQN